MLDRSTKSGAIEACARSNTKASARRFGFRGGQFVPASNCRQSVSDTPTSSAARSTDQPFSTRSRVSIPGTNVSAFMAQILPAKCAAVNPVAGTGPAPYSHGVGGRGHKDHPLEACVIFALGTRPDRTVAVEFRRRLAFLRRFHDRELDGREQRFSLEFVLCRCDVVAASKKARLLPWPLDEGGDPEWQGREKFGAEDHAEAGRLVQTRPKARALIRSLLELCELHKPDPVFLRAEAIAAAERARAPRDKIAALQVVIRVCPEAAQGLRADDSNALLGRALATLEHLARAGHLKSTGEVSDDAAPAPVGNGARGTALPEEPAAPPVAGA